VQWGIFVGIETGQIVSFSLVLSLFPGLGSDVMPVELSRKPEFIGSLVDAKTLEMPRP